MPKKKRKKKPPKKKMFLDWNTFFPFKTMNANKMRKKTDKALDNKFKSANKRLDQIVVASCKSIEDDITKAAENGKYQVKIKNTRLKNLKKIDKCAVVEHNKIRHLSRSKDEIDIRCEEIIERYDQSIKDMLESFEKKGFDTSTNEIISWK